MKRRLLIGFIAIILVVGASAALLAGAVVRSVAREQLLDRLTKENQLVAEAIKGQDALVALPQVISTSRLTLIAPDGEVRYDSWARIPLPGHEDRPEIIKARETGFGSAIRYSETTASTAIYAASMLPSGDVLRVAAPEHVARGIATSMAPWLVFGLVLILILAIFFANSLGDKLLRPLLEIDLDHPEEARVYDEVLPLIRRIDSQNRHNKAQLAQLEASRQELDALLQGMHEGFIALGAKEEIILINPSAQTMLGVNQQQAVGRPLLAVNRSPVMLDALAALRQQGTAEGLLEMDGRVYQLIASRIEGRPGAILLLSDQTYRLQGESMRKHFTANVSHELRTPLTTIRGYAELLSQGMVKPEDAGRFHALIYQESQRMLILIEDILRLSRLDEGYAGGERSRVSLHEQAKLACKALTPSAQAKDVVIDYQGEEAAVHGDTTLIYELCTNLIDNAIKYNVQGGLVRVRVTGGAQATLSVEDTGIGIPSQHQARVFERFYRVDASRSKQTGGTGLGLSIVKHAAEYHGARVTLHSQPGKGTTITVAFPPCRGEN